MIKFKIKQISDNPEIFGSKDYVRIFKEIFIFILLVSSILLGIWLLVKFNPPKEFKEQVLIIKEKKQIEVWQVVDAELTAYNADVFQTDSDPTIMASGKTVYNGAAACPSILELGTKIEFENKIYTCEDRMSKRFRKNNFFDIFMWNYDEAIKFGRKKGEVKILKGYL